MVVPTRPQHPCHTDVKPQNRSIAQSFKATSCLASPKNIATKDVWQRCLRIWWWLGWVKCLEQKYPKTAAVNTTHKSTKTGNYDDYEDDFQEESLGDDDLGNDNVDISSAGIMRKTNLGKWSVFLVWRMVDSEDNDYATKFWKFWNFKDYIPKGVDAPVRRHHLYHQNQSNPCTNRHWTIWEAPRSGTLRRCIIAR